MEQQQPFSGVRVAEFGQFVAVPFCAQLLAEGGAEVIKIEAPEGDPTRRMGQLAPGETRIYISRNRGKHALPLRLRVSRSRAHCPYDRSIFVPSTRPMARLRSPAPVASCRFDSVTPLDSRTMGFPPQISPKRERTTTTTP